MEEGTAAATGLDASCSELLLELAALQAASSAETRRHRLALASSAAALAAEGSPDSCSSDDEASCPSPAWRSADGAPPKTPAAELALYDSDGSEPYDVELSMYQLNVRPWHCIEDVMAEAEATLPLESPARSPVPAAPQAAAAAAASAASAASAAGPPAFFPPSAAADALVALEACRAENESLRLERRVFVKAALELYEKAAALKVARTEASNSLLREPADTDTQPTPPTRWETLKGRMRLPGAQSHSLDLSEVARHVAVIKAGTLRKRSNATIGTKVSWKSKTVTLRRGSLVYEAAEAYDPGVTGSGNRGRARREDGPKRVDLDPRESSCRALEERPRRPGRPGRDAGALAHSLEVVVGKGEKRHVFVAASAAECAAWVQAFSEAISGAAAARGGGGSRSVDLGAPTMRRTASGSRVDVLVDSSAPDADRMKAADREIFLLLHESVARAGDEEAYMNVICGGTDACGTRVTVSVPWVRAQLEGPSRGAAAAGGAAAAVPYANSSDLAQLWKDMKRDRVSVNGTVLVGEDGPEAIVSAVTREVLSAAAGGEGKSTTHHRLTEVTALGAARDILLACNRTASAGDTYLCIDALVGRPELVVVVPAQQLAAPLGVVVTPLYVHDGEDAQQHLSPTSEGGRGRGGGGGGRAATDTSGARPTRLDLGRLSPRHDKRPRAMSSSASDEESRSRSSSLQSEGLAGSGGPNGGKTLSKNPGSSDGDSLDGRQSGDAKSRPAALEVVVSASTAYRVCSADPTGDPALDTWANVYADWSQRFEIACGGGGTGGLGDACQAAPAEVHVRIAAGTGTERSPWG